MSQGAPQLRPPRSRSASARVLLVDPRSPKTFWSFDGPLALVGRRVLLPPWA
ncbi:MAG: hypothetical protein ACK4V5_08275 [Cyanobium sp.]|jgi:hypothetical protein